LEEHRRPEVEERHRQLVAEILEGDTHNPEEGILEVERHFGEDNPEEDIHLVEGSQLEEHRLVEEHQIGILGENQEHHSGDIPEEGTLEDGNLEEDIHNLEEGSQ
jgi:hypothetical protein